MQPVLITGASGRLGRAFVRLCDERHLAYRATSRSELDIANPDAVAAALDRHAPWLVINAAGYADVDDAEHAAERCERDNVLGAHHLARGCARAAIRLVTFSSDLVFDGAKQAPYDEHDRPAPLGVYGRSQHAAEARVCDAHPGTLVIRTSALFSPWDAAGFVARVVRELAAGREVRAAGDTTVSPTYVPDLVHASLDLAIDGATGVWHLANAGATTWAELARDAAAIAGHPGHGVVAVPAEALGWRARRPRFSALASIHGALLPPLGDALRRHHQARREGNHRGTVDC